MRIRSPSLPELHAFVAVMETRSFSRAGQRLSITQGAVSRAVLRLEARLGRALLDRDPAGVRPTLSGQAYYALIQPAIAALEAAVPSATADRERELRVSVVPTFNMQWLVPRLPAFAAEHPEVRVVFKRYCDDDDLLSDDVDCWLRTRKSASSRWPRHVRATYIAGREIVPICHPAVREIIRTPHDVLAMPLLHHLDYPGNWALWFGAHGVDARGLKLAAGFDLAAGLIEAVAANMGMAVVQRCLIQRELAEGRVSIPLDSPVSTGRGYYLCAARSRDDGPTQLAFKDWLLRQAAAERPQFETSASSTSPRERHYMTE